MAGGGESSAQNTRTNGQKLGFGSADIVQNIDERNSPDLLQSNASRELQCLDLAGERGSVSFFPGSLTVQVLCIESTVSAKMLSE